MTCLFQIVLKIECNIHTQKPFCPNYFHCTVVLIKREQKIQKKVFKKIKLYVITEVYAKIFL